MLKDCEVMATVAVRQLARARAFYEGKLGLQPAESEPQMVTYRSGGATLMVYESQFAGTNKATAATWNVPGGLEQMVRELKAKGVVFEHYDDLPDTTRDGDIHRSGGISVAWCKDPDGNILNLAQA